MSARCPLEAMDTARRDLQIAAEYQGNQAAAESAPALGEARAAVAELVEAARDIHENGYGTAANKRLAAALAKFGGAA